jgi:hypothetical protein
MRKSKFNETQIVGILRDAESGVPVPDLLRSTASARRRSSSGAAITGARPSRM